MDSAFWTEVVCKGLRVYYVWPDGVVDVAQIVAYDETEKTVNLVVATDNFQEPVQWKGNVPYAPVGADGTLVANSWHL